jgi:hypothetical protein
MTGLGAPARSPSAETETNLLCTLFAAATLSAIARACSRHKFTKWAVSSAVAWSAT